MCCGGNAPKRSWILVILENTVRFADLNLPAPIMSAIEKLGFETPTPIQAEAIPPLLDGRDIVGVAQTGTGKTAAFGLPMLAHLDPSEPRVQAIVLAPTRELAVQSGDAIASFAADLPDITVVTVYGGAPYPPQIRALKNGAQIVVGTPGRIIDLIEKDVLHLDQVKVLVLDEADEMLRMGFAEDVETIASAAPQPGERITALFSATMPPAIQRVAQQHLIEPVRVEIAPQSSTVDTVEQTYAILGFRHKKEALARVLSTADTDAAIVFVRTRVDVDDVSSDLTRRGFKASGLSGDVSQAERERIIARLRDGSLDVLVATDVAARGLDVERIGLVVNYDVPREAEAYVHRIGRTGRAGRTGRSLTFFTPKERFRLKQIEKLTGTHMTQAGIPTRRDVASHTGKQLLAEVAPRLERGHLDLYEELLETVTQQLGLDYPQVAAALLANAVGDTGQNRGAAQHADEDFANGSFETGGKKRKGRGSRAGTRMEPTGSGKRYRVEVGRKDGVKPGAIVGAITGEAGLSGDDLGRIEIFPTFSLVDIAGELPASALRKIARAAVAGRRLRIREDTGPEPNDSTHRKHRGKSKSFSDRGGRGFDRNAHRAKRRSFKNGRR